MPKIDIPLRNVEDIKQLRKDKQFLADVKRLTKITDRMKAYEEELKGRPDEDEPGLRQRVFEKLSTVLPEGEKSVQAGDHRLTAMQQEPRKTLDKAKLLKHISAAKLEKCYTVGERPRPTVQVSRLETSEEKVARKVAGKLRTGVEPD